MRRCDRDPDAGEAPRADSDDDLFRRAAIHQHCDHRHQPLGMAAADDLVSACDAGAGSVEQGGGAGGARRIEGQKHGRNSGHMRRDAASP